MQKRKIKKHLIVLDTNIIVSFVLGSRNAAKIMHAVMYFRRFIPALSLDLLTEIKITFYKPNIIKRFDPEDAAEFIRQLMAIGHYVEPRKALDICEDPNDNMLFECALEAGAECLVSGDKKVLKVGKYRNTSVLSLTDFIKQYL